MMKQKIGSGTTWEDSVGYSRAIRIDNRIEVAGTTAMDGEQLIGKGDAYKQTKFIFEKIETALNQLGASLADVVRTRMYVTNIEDWEAIGRAHGEQFRTIKPVATMVEVSRLIHPDLKVEIEVSAILMSE
ncbi:RidA family protein [Aureispira anguillae]|uniref:RidA family protein n=1 Tax=Aureispira anguillae TaxID=2864201 RepID=A0A915YKR1_9BACT|nr:RidA family protein [Aureispira anguillae]BDS14880.1 RidA family protein [Aureispira anguillae]